MSVNPNNHALDGGRASSAMEVEAVAALAKMFDWPQHLGHLSSGGTFANLEALWVAGQLAPGRAIAASDQAHYTHNPHLERPRPALRHCPPPTRPAAWISPLSSIFSRTENIGTVVVTLGTTAVGSVDPLDQILTLQKKHNFRIHVDAVLRRLLHPRRQPSPPKPAPAFDAIPHADSLVIDPHKHGLITTTAVAASSSATPPSAASTKHDSPYTYFSSKDLHLGEISLECSRAGASAVALWATQQLLPYTPVAHSLKVSNPATPPLSISTSASPNLPASLPHPTHLNSTSSSGLPAPQPPKLPPPWHRRSSTNPPENDLHLALAQLPGPDFFHQINGKI